VNDPTGEVVQWNPQSAVFNRLREKRATFSIRGSIVPFAKASDPEALD